MSFRSDVLVVGAGSSGCAVAAGLARRGLDVVLLEAGSLVDAHPSAFNCDLSGLHDWNLEAAISGGRRVVVPRGRAVGGSSVINTCVALRPDPWVFDRWGLDAPGWSWDDVLPYFRRLEHDADFPSDAVHGHGGPMPIVRWRPDELEPPSRWFQDAAVVSGHPPVDDLNRPGAMGVGPVPMNRVGDRRVSADLAYLGSMVGSGSPRLVTGWLVDRLTVRRGRVTGLEARRGGQTRRFEAAHTVLCAGSYETPAILLRSGIGAATWLRDRGIDVVQDLPAVGVGLHDHCQVHLEATGPTTGPSCPGLQILVRLTSAGSRLPNDTQLCVLNRVDSKRYVQDGPWVDRPVMLCALLMYSTSRGRVSLDSADSGRTSIEIDYVQADDDRRRLRCAIRALAEIIDHGADDVVVVREPFNVADLSDQELDAIISRRVQSAHHPMGTARMGRSDDQRSVVDEELRVLGVDGLSVADASVVPLSVNANTHLTCTMIGERHADHLAI